MRKKNLILFQDHVKYIHNDIVKHFRVRILRYAEHVQDMHNLAKYLPPPSMKDKSYKSANWDVRNKGLSENDIRIAIKDGLPSYMQDKLEDNQEEYSSLDHEYWCDLLSTI